MFVEVRSSAPVENFDNLHRLELAMLAQKPRLVGEDAAGVEFVESERAYRSGM